MLDLAKFISVSKQVFPKSRIAEFDPFWEDAFAYADINSNARATMFLAQVGHECQGFTRFQENLNYSAQGLADTWPNRFSINPQAKVKVPNELAKNIARNPELISNTVYANRYGNGNIESGDGWKYSGKGPMMLTFHDNYFQFDHDTNNKYNITQHPEKVLLPEVGIETAAWFWKINALNVPSDRKDIGAARKKINGGLIGLGDVTFYYKKIEKLLS